MSKKKSSDIEILLGAPGTGKTTELINRVMSHIENGGHANRIVYVSFTRQAAQVAVSRAVERFKLDKAYFPYFRTIHSLAYLIKRYTPDEVVQDEHYAAFGEMYGYELNPSVNTSTFHIDYGRGNGASLLRLYDMHINKKIPYSELGVATRQEVSLLEVGIFAERWESYKKKHGLKDFSDFLTTPISL